MPDESCTVVGTARAETCRKGGLEQCEASENSRMSLTDKMGPCRKASAWGEVGRVPVEALLHLFPCSRRVINLHFCHQSAAVEIVLMSNTGLPFDKTSQAYTILMLGCKGSPAPDSLSLCPDSH